MKRSDRSGASDGERTERESREYEAAVSEGWPALPDGGGPARRRGHEPASGGRPNDHAHDDDHD
jgi:hypothetical protein